jgi:hypothetical protein
MARVPAGQKGARGGGKGLAEVPGCVRRADGSPSSATRDELRQLRQTQGDQVRRQGPPVDTGVVQSKLDSFSGK